MFRFTIRDVLWLMVVSNQTESESDDDEDDGLQIGWPVARLINATAVILLVALLVRWVGCG